jgi:hypothetical protein
VEEGGYRVTTNRVLGILAFMATGVGLLSGQTTLNVKPGQWETTTSGSATGAAAMLPPGVLDKLTPDQRAKMEAAMKGAGQPRTSASSGCVTKEDVAKGFQPSNLPNTCKYDVTLSTASQMRLAVTCETGQAKSTGTVQVDAVDSEHVKGSVQMATALANGQAMNNNMTFTSKWVGPVCTEKNSGK